MKEKNEMEELQTRREFFKEASRKALPLLALTAIGSTILASCEKESTSTSSRVSSSSSSGCKGCSGSCSSSCSGDCDGGCTNNCDSLCGGDCWAYCESTYKT